MLKWNFLCFNACPLHLIMSLGTTEKSLAPSSLLTPSGVYAHWEDRSTPDSQILTGSCRFVDALHRWSFSTESCEESAFCLGQQQQPWGFSACSLPSEGNPAQMPVFTRLQQDLIIQARISQRGKDKTVFRIVQVNVFAKAEFSACFYQV